MNMTITTRLYEGLSKLEDNFNRDKRISYFPLIGSPWPMFALMLLYLVFVQKWGPNLMKNRTPYNLKGAMKIYNIAQILINAYVFVEALRNSYFNSKFDWFCQEYNTQDTREHLMNLRWPAYVYYLSKYLDFFDTIFFVLRKKHTQVTFLHVYHHASMVFCVWAYCTLLFGSHNTLIGVVNALIHVLMYTYYLTAIVVPKANLTPWKRLLTKLQIIQFSYMIGHFTLPILDNWCNLDLFWVWLTLLQNVLLFILFSNFYYRTYLGKTTGYLSTTNRISKRLQEPTGSLCKITEKID